MVEPKARRARRLHRNATEAEQILWRALRALRLPARVRRRHPIGGYVADFAVPSRKLIIEISGGQHATATARDKARIRKLETRGWREIRFSSDEVTSNRAGVLDTITAEIKRSPSSSRPLPPRKGGGGE